MVMKSLASYVWLLDGSKTELGTWILVVQCGMYISSDMYWLSGTIITLASIGMHKPTGPDLQSTSEPGRVSDISIPSTGRSACQLAYHYYSYVAGNTIALYWLHLFKCILLSTIHATRGSAVAITSNGFNGHLPAFGKERRWYAGFVAKPICWQYASPIHD